VLKTLWKHYSEVGKTLSRTNCLTTSADDTEMNRIHGARPFRRDSSVVHTYSIVAFDHKTHEMGVAVQSHAYSVGTIVSWGEAGIGVIATQATANPSFGPRGLKMLKRGLKPDEVVDKLIGADKGRDTRQLAILDSKGRVAAYTGKNCIAAAGHTIGKNCSAQANLMVSDKVWPAMIVTFENTKGRLAERMLAALDAAESAGGDIRGRQSAAMLVVRGKSTGKIWEDRPVDLRVDDSTEPLAELRRLLVVHRFNEYMNNYALELEKHKMALAMKYYKMGENLFPDNEEMIFWHAIDLVNNGKHKDALPQFQKLFVKNEIWREIMKRIIPAGLLKVDKIRIDEILRQ
jgi:uncharacterized Ntn-hydrolase superfamily protein